MLPVVKRVWQAVWQPCWTNSTVRSSGCQTGLYNRFYKHGLTTGWTNRLFVQPVGKPGCTTGSTTGCIHDTAVCQTGCQTGLTIGWMFVYTIRTTGCQQPVSQRVWQPVVSCRPVHRESKKGATLTMAITLSILDRFAKFFHCYKEQ